MVNADGSVIIRARVDVSKADKDLAKLKGSIERTEREIEELSDEKETDKQKSVFSAAELDAEKAKLQEMKKQLEEMREIAKDVTLSPSTREEAKAQIPGQREAISDQQTRVRLLQAEYNKIENSVSRYDDRIANATRKLERQQEEAGELAQKINSVSRASLKMGEAQEKAEKSMRKFGLRLREVLRSALVFTLITQTLAKFREWMGKVVNTNDEARQAVARLKAALLTLAQPLVNVIIPAFTSFVDFLAKAVTYVAQLSAILFGTTAEDAANSAEEMKKEQDAIEGVGDAAKKAEKQLASFDEINKLTGETASSSADVIQPDFSGLQFAELPEWMVNFTVTLRDILFKWKDLTAGDVLQKVVAALEGIAGAVIGFSVGGVGGAVIGMAIGFSLSGALNGVSFSEGDGVNVEGILSSICTALGAVAGGIIGFSVGGLNGAAIGLTIGASASVIVSDILFNEDSKVDTEELLSSLSAALTAIAGGIIGFTLGGPMGAAIGATVGAGATVLLGSMVFNKDGTVSGEEIAKSLVAALGAIVGGVIGFTVGGPGGAFIGTVAGAAATVVLSGLVFDGDGMLNTKEVLQSLCLAAGAIVGAAIGFAVGGPLGAAIGLTVGAVLTVVITDVLFSGFETLKETVPSFKGIGPDYSWMFEKTSSVEIPTVNVPPVNIASGSLIPKNAAFTQNGKSLAENLFPQGGFGSLSPNNSASGSTTVVLEVDGREFGRAVYDANAVESGRIGTSLVVR